MYVLTIKTIPFIAVQSLLSREYKLKKLSEDSVEYQDMTDVWSGHSEIG